MMRRFFLFALIAGFSFATGTLAKADPKLVISGVNIAQKDKQTVLTIEASQSPVINVFALADPSRIIIDLPDADFNIARAKADKKSVIKNYRFGHFAEGQSRMVFDITKPVVIGDVSVASRAEGEPYKITIELNAATTAEFNAMVEKRADALKTPAQQVASLDKPVIEGAASLPLIVLDAGHGGIDSGANGSDGSYEKHVTLSLVKHVQHELLATGQVRVLLTRDKDVFVPLHQRREIAQSAKAALFMSIHADSFGRQKESPRGATVYTLSEKASDSTAAAFAERENSADEIAGIDNKKDSPEVADILFDLMQRETKSFSTSFAHHLTAELKDQIVLNNNPRRAAGFIVLKAPDVPSVLLEMGYLSNEADRRLMQSEDWQVSTSKAISKAVLAFLEQSQVTGATLPPLPPETGK